MRGSLRCSLVSHDQASGEGLDTLDLLRCAHCTGVQAKAEAEYLKRSSEGQEVPGLELAALQAKFGALAAKHEEALGKLAQLAAAREAAEAAREAAAGEAHTHQQHARSHAIRCCGICTPIECRRCLCTVGASKDVLPGHLCGSSCQQQSAFLSAAYFHCMSAASRQEKVGASASSLLRGNTGMQV